MQHRLSNINKETKTADCKVCGPVAVRYRPGRDQYECKVKYNAGARKNKAKTRGMIVTPEQVVEAYLSQAGKCALCSVDLGDSYNRDHDHATGMFRGLLCTSCNLGLGYFKDNVEALKKAIVYLS